MTKPTTLAWMTCALLAVHTSAHAQSTAQSTAPSTAQSTASDTGTNTAQSTDDRASPARPIEITPYVLMGSGAASGVGTAVRWPIGARFGVELETELKRAEVTAVAIALSLVYDLPAIGRVTPYLAAGIGLERFGRTFYRPDGQPLHGSDTGVNVNAGGGVRMTVTDRWGVRSDARWRHRFGREAADQWRIYNGATLGVGGRR